MKRPTILALALASLAALSPLAQAQYDRDGRYDERRYDGRAYGGSKLDYEFDRLNAMFAHVERELQRYGANRPIWS